MEDKPLFGPVDQVVNTLECEISWVKGEIKHCEKAIDRNKAEIDILQTRLKNLDESMKIVRKKAEREMEPAPPASLSKAKTSAKKTAKK
jgi:predicted ribosome quality control (RQC) complex YloA/Tae2 family protein